MLVYTRGPSGPEITHLDKADHDVLHCAMVAILAIDQIAFSNSESDAVWRVSRLPLWPPSWQQFWISMSPIKFQLNLTYFWEEMWYEEFQLGEDFT